MNNWHDLMIKSCAGDSNAYEELLSELSAFLNKFLYKFANNTEDRQDLTQNILLSLHLSRASFDTNLEFRPWFFTLVHHRVVDFIRKNKQKKYSSDSSDTHVYDNHYKIILNELTQELEERELIILKQVFIEGNEQEIIANDMGLSLNNLRVIMHRVKTKILNNLKS